MINPLSLSKSRNNTSGTRQSAGELWYN